VQRTPQGQLGRLPDDDHVALGLRYVGQRRGRLALRRPDRHGDILWHAAQCAGQAPPDGSVSLGRIVFTARALPAVRPVCHLVDGDHVVIRTDRNAAIISELRAVRWRRARAAPPVPSLSTKSASAGPAKIPYPGRFSTICARNLPR
jgi:hypothetical protein